jgi:hypothetical protein
MPALLPTDEQFDFDFIEKKDGMLTVRVNDLHKSLQLFSSILEFSVLYLKAHAAVINSGNITILLEEKKDELLQNV